MARKVDNEQGFLIIEISSEEALDLGWGIYEGCICMHCNDIIKDPVYYVPILNDTLCPECLDEWLETAIHYDEDIKYEIDKYNRVARKLGLETVPTITERKKHKND